MCRLYCSHNYHSFFLTTICSFTVPPTSDYDPEEDRKASRLAERAEAKQRRMEMKQAEKAKEMKQKSQEKSRVRLRNKKRKKRLRKARKELGNVLQP